MKGVTTTLAQIQQRILQFVGPDTFLVGHSLENDLRVMKLVHLKNLDTAIFYPNARVMLAALPTNSKQCELQSQTVQKALPMTSNCCRHVCSLNMLVFLPKHASQHHGRMYKK